MKLLNLRGQGKFEIAHFWIGLVRYLLRSFQQIFSRSLSLLMCIMRESCVFFAKIFPLNVQADFHAYSRFLLTVMPSSFLRAGQRCSFTLAVLQFQGIICEPHFFSLSHLAFPLTLAAQQCCHYPDRYTVTEFNVELLYGLSDCFDNLCYDRKSILVLALDNSSDFCVLVSRVLL